VERDHPSPLRIRRHLLRLFLKLNFSVRFGGMNTAVSVPVHAICYRGDSNWFSRKFHELLQIQVGEGGTPKHPLGGLVTESDRGSGSAFTAHTSDGHALASPAHQAAAC